MAEKEDKKYIYFIYSFEKNKNIEITSDFTLKIIKNFENKNENKEEFNTNLYEIEICKKKLKKVDSIKIQLIEKNEKPATFLIDVSDNRLYTFVYNVDFRYDSFILNFTRNLSRYNLTDKEKYEIFKQIDKKDKNYDISEDLIFYTLKLLKESKYYTFSFFVSLLGDIKNIFNMLNVLQLFNINKVRFEKEEDNKNIVLDKLLKKIDFIIKIQKEKIQHDLLESNKIINNDLLFILIFLYTYQRNKIQEILKNRELNKYFFKILLDNKKNKYKQNLFPELILPGFIINEFIKSAKNYRDTILIILYNNNFYETLEIINENIKQLSDFIKKEKENEKNYEKIKFDDFIKINENDDLDKIKKELEILFTSEKIYKINFVDISCQMLNRYMIINNEKIDKLICLYQIIAIIIKHKNRFNYLDQAMLMHKNIYENFALNKKLINMNLLLFLEIPPTSKKVLDKAIINNIEIDKIDENFISKFKKINWCEMLNISKKDFILQICNMIPDINHFGKLFLLFDFNVDIDKFLIDKIKEKFIPFLEDSTEDEKQININDCSKLIYYLNAKKCEIKTFINDYIYIFFTPYEINIIYSEICSNPQFKEFNQDLKDLIHEFYTKKENDFCMKSIYLAFDIKYNKNFHPGDLISYYFDSNDFFDLGQKDKFSFLEKILIQKLRNENCLKFYIINCNTQINIIIDKINNGSVEFKLINEFFKNNKEEELNKRIKIITEFMGENKKHENLFEEIKKKMKEINEIIHNLNNIKQKLNLFFKNTKKDKIEEIQILLNEIEVNNIDFCSKNKEKIEKYFNMENINELPLIDEMSNTFFKIIYKNTKKTNENELETIDITKKKIKNLVNVLNSKSFSLGYINKFSKIMDQFNEKQYKNLKGEIDDLVRIIDNKIEINKDNMINNLKYIWKKDLLLNLSILFESLLENKYEYVQNTEFSKINQVINRYLISPKNTKVIEMSINLYKNYGIELIEDNNFVLFQTIKLNKNMKEIITFIKNIGIEQLKTRILECENNKDYDYNFIKNNLNKLIEFKKYLKEILSNNFKDIDIIKQFIRALFFSEELKDDFIAILNNYSSILEFILINIQ